MFYCLKSKADDTSEKFSTNGKVSSVKTLDTLKEIKKLLEGYPSDYVLQNEFLEDFNSDLGSSGSRSVIYVDNFGITYSCISKEDRSNLTIISDMDMIRYDNYRQLLKSRGYGEDYIRMIYYIFCSIGDTYLLFGNSVIYEELERDKILDLVFKKCELKQIFTLEVCK